MTLPMTRMQCGVAAGAAVVLVVLCTSAPAYPTTTDLTVQVSGGGIVLITPLHFDGEFSVHDGYFSGILDGMRVVDSRSTLGTGWEVAVSFVPPPTTPLALSASPIDADSFRYEITLITPTPEPGLIIVDDGTDAGIIASAPPGATALFPTIEWVATMGLSTGAVADHSTLLGTIVHSVT